MEQPAGDQIESLTERVIGCAIEVHRALGPGLLECVYRDCMLIEMRLEGLKVERDRRVAIEYRGQRVPASLVLDLVVERSVVVELKTVERIHSVHLAQVITYLKLTGCPAGLLMNFNSTSLRNGLRRLDHPTRYAAQRS
jgi:GxxExxY protein